MVPHPGPRPLDPSNGSRTHTEKVERHPPGDIVVSYGPTGELVSSAP